MATPFIIYIRAVGIYALITIPALFLPVMYIISMMYVLFYGWFAWVLFTIIYIITVFCNPSYIVKVGILTLAVVVAVVFAFQMLEVLGTQDNIWSSGPFLLFPAAAIFSGWISLSISRKKVMMSSRNLLLNILDEGLNDNKIS